MALRLQPYKDESNNFLSILAKLQLLITLFSALLVKLEAPFFAKDTDFGELEMDLVAWVVIASNSFVMLSIVSLVLWDVYLALQYVEEGVKGTLLAEKWQHLWKSPLRRIHATPRANGVMEVSVAESKPTASDTTILQRFPSQRRMQGVEANQISETAHEHPSKAKKTRVRKGHEEEEGTAWNRGGEEETDGAVTAAAAAGHSHKSTRRKGKRHNKGIKGKVMNKEGGEETEAAAAAFAAGHSLKKAKKKGKSRNKGIKGKVYKEGGEETVPVPVAVAAGHSRKKARKIGKRYTEAGKIVVLNEEVDEETAGGLTAAATGRRHKKASKSQEGSKKR